MNPRHDLVRALSRAHLLPEPELQVVPRGYIPYGYHNDPEMIGPCWAVDPYSGRCCDFCDVWQAIVCLPSPPNTPHLQKPQPDAAGLLDELSYYNPHQHAHILRLYETIHGHYMLGYDRDGPESYYLSREMEKLSKMLQRACRGNPRSGRGFGDIASQLKYMGRDIIITPRRKRYHTYPRPRYSDGSFYAGEPHGWPYRRF
jgi:hypothetical protein